MIGVIIVLIIVVALIVAMWKIMEKAGRPGWNAIVPIYNVMVLAEIGGKPSWWGLLTLIPYVGIVFNIWIWNLVVQKFGKSTGFTVGVVLLPFVFIPMLGFGDAQYQSDDMSSDVADFGNKETESNFE